MDRSCVTTKKGWGGSTECRDSWGCWGAGCLPFVSLMHENKSTEVVVWMLGRGHVVACVLRHVLGSIVWYGDLESIPCLSINRLTWITTGVRNGVNIQYGGI